MPSTDPGTGDSVGRILAVKELLDMQQKHQVEK